MAVRPKRSRKASAPPATPTLPAPPDPASEETDLHLRIRDAVRSLNFALKNARAIHVRVARQFAAEGATEAMVRRQHQIVLEENRALADEAIRNGRYGQIVSVHGLYGVMEQRLASALSAEAQARSQGKEPPKPNRLVPRYAELIACQDLIARLEGNVAPKRVFVASAQVGKEVLDLLGTTSAEEAAEWIGRGRALLLERGVIDTDGEEVA